MEYIDPHTNQVYKIKEVNTEELSINEALYQGGYDKLQLLTPRTNSEEKQEYNFIPKKLYDKKHILQGKYLDKSEDTYFSQSLNNLKYEFLYYAWFVNN
jgi:hypothetical protein